MPINWDFFHNRVQKGMTHGLFLSGRSTIIGAGPPNILGFSGASLGTPGSNAAASDDVVFLIGLVQSLSMSQGAQVQRFHEIGSVRHYFITGHAAPALQLGRVMYYGPNLLRSLYAYYSSPTSTPGNVTINSLMNRYNSMPSNAGINKHSVQITPGEQNFFANLGSDLFSQPVGLLIMLRDQNEQTYGLVYAENCYVDSHTMGTDAQGIILSENVTIQAERLMPLGSGAVSLTQTITETIATSLEGEPSQVATVS